MSIDHTIEQLEAARRDHLIGTAAKIVRRHLVSTKPHAPTIRACMNIAEAYFANTEEGVALLSNWKPS
jgi:hypothetical protein